jgi:hypothetical protein
MPQTVMKCPVFAREWGDSGGIRAQTAQLTTGTRISEPIATLTMITAGFMDFLHAIHSLERIILRLISRLESQQA